MRSRPVVDWRTDRPPANEKVLALTKWGVLVLGRVNSHEWDSGNIICWVPCPKRPANWDRLLELRQAK